MNNETHKAQRDAWERGYKEALLDVYLFLSGQDGALDIEKERFDLIVAMTEQITSASSGLLVEVGT